MNKVPNITHHGLEFIPKVYEWIGKLLVAFWANSSNPKFQKHDYIELVYNEFDDEWQILTRDNDGDELDLISVLHGELVICFPCRWCDKITKELFWVQEDEYINSAVCQLCYDEAKYGR